MQHAHIVVYTRYLLLGLQWQWLRRGRTNLGKWDVHGSGILMCMHVAIVPPIVVGAW